MPADMDGGKKGKKKSQKGKDIGKVSWSVRSMALKISESWEAFRDDSESHFQYRFFQSHSMDVLLEDEAAVLVEALEAIGDEKPLVARSIPKHARVVKKEDTSMKNCLFEKEVRNGKNETKIALRLS